MNFIHPTSKLPKTKESIFSVMSQMASKYNAINLSQGFPDFEIDPIFKELVFDAIQNGFNQYCPSAGLISLRNEISNLIKNCYSVDYNPETEITITSGATEALFVAIQALVLPNDEVIVFEPCYDSYVPAIELAGGKAIGIPLVFPNYSIDWDLLQNSINQRTKAIIINSPHNPSGSILTYEDLLKLAKIIENTNICIISDEVYEYICFDDNKHISVCSIPELKERSFIICSFGKSLHSTGWKVGYCYANEKLTQEFRKIHQFVTFSTATPLQVAISKYIEQNPTFYLKIKELYENKRNFFLEKIKTSRFKPLNTSGTYFQLLEYNQISNLNEIDFAKELVINHKIASIPLSVFYLEPQNNSVLRFCFAKKEETLEKAAEMLCKL